VTAPVIDRCVRFGSSSVAVKQGNSRMALKASAAVLAAALMTAQTAFAATPAAAPLAPLAPGKAAGLHQAQNGPPANMVVIGAGIVLAAGAVYLITGTHYHVPPQKSASSSK
jgi:hypothetical protein